MKVKLLGIGVIVALLALVGCSSSDTTTATEADQTTATSTSAPNETTADTASAIISLPDGWTIEQAISAEDVASVTNETMQFFPEGASASQKGKPAGSYLVTGKDGSKIRFDADVNGGTKGFELIKSFAIAETIQEVSGVGNEAYVCEFSETDHGIVVLSGDLVVRIDWNPTVYTTDKTEFGTKLAQKLLDNLYK